MMEIGQYTASQLVFVDESAVDRRTPHRAYGWAQSGERAEMHGYFVRGGRYAMQSLYANSRPLTGIWYC